MIQAFSLPGSAHDLATGVRDSFELNYKEIVTALLMRGGLLPSNGPLWSLYLEWQLYILAGAAAIVLTNGKRVFRFFAAVFGGYILWRTQSENWVYFGVWIFAAVVSFSPIWRIRLMVPRIVVETGDFSYSLCVIHFPLLLLSMSLFQE